VTATLDMSLPLIMADDMTTRQYPQKIRIHIRLSWCWFY